MKVNLKNIPRLQLKDLLRRRKMTLRQLLDESGTTTYAGLSQYCDRLGVCAPTESEFNLAMPSSMMISNPQHGVISLPAPPVISEMTGARLDDDEEQSPVLPDQSQEKRTKRRRESLPIVFSSDE